MFWSPQILLYVRSLCQGLRTAVVSAAFPRMGRIEECSPVSQETLHTASITFGNPISVLRHHYYVKEDVLGRSSRPGSIHGDGSARAGDVVYVDGSAMSS